MVGGGRFFGSLQTCRRRHQRVPEDAGSNAWVDMWKEISRVTELHDLFEDSSYLFCFFLFSRKNCSTFEMGKLIGLVVSDNKHEFSMKVKQILQYNKNILIIIIYFIKIYICSFEYSYKIRSKIFQVISFKNSTAQSSHSSRNLLFIFYIKEHFELQQVTIILIV